MRNRSLSHPPTLVSALLVLGLVFSAPAPVKPVVGVNLISVGNQYMDTLYREPALTPFMERLAKDGMGRISIRITWSTMMPSPGVLNQTYLSNYERVATAAGRAGMKVMVDFHTLFGTGLYACPKWVAEEPGDDGRPGVVSVVMAARSRKIRGYYLDMVREISRRAKTWPGVDTVSVMNEPWSLDYKDPKAAQAEFRLIEDWACEAARVVKEEAPALKRTLRFTASINPWAPEEKKRFQWERLSGDLEIFSVNAYANPLEKPEAAELVLAAAARCRAEGRDLWITEFGRERGEQAVEQGAGSIPLQAAYMADYMKWLETTEHGPSVALAWVIQPSGKEGMNLYDGENKTFLPAWKVLSEGALRLGGTRKP